jgi:ParB-like chromosome segregation protein Spo0J
MQIQKAKTSDIKVNPNNPRVIKDDKFKKLVQSVKDFPQMLEIRPIVVNDDMIVLGGNMRFKACKEAGLKEVPIIIAENLTEEQQKEFIIKDNVSGGEWNWDIIADNWDYEILNNWGLDIPGFDLNDEFREETPYNFMNKVTIEFKTTEEAQVYFEKATKEGLNVKMY